MDQNLKFGGTIDYGDPYLEFFKSKVIKINAILHDAAGVELSPSGEGPGVYYMNGRGLKSCLVGHTTGVLFCFHVKVLPPSNFFFVNFRSSMSCIVLDSEPAVKNFTKDLGVFFMGMLKDAIFVL